MNGQDKIILDVSLFIVFIFIGYCLKSVCFSNNNEDVYLDRIIELQNELSDLERQTNQHNDEQRIQINNQQDELREFRNNSTLVVAVPSAPPVISGTSPVIARPYSSPCFRRPRDPNYNS